MRCRVNNLVPKYRITINGKDLEGAAPVANSAIERLLFEEAFFQTSHVDLTFQDALDFDLLPAMIDPTMNPILELFMGYHPNPVKVFEGHIVEAELSGDQGENPKLRLKAYDYSWPLKVPREPASYTDTSLYSIVSKLIKKDRSGLSLTPVIDPVEPLKKYTAEDYRSVNKVMTDWEFLTKAARMFGYKLYCRFKEIHIEDKNRLEVLQGGNVKTFIYKPRKGQVDDIVTFPLLAFNPKAAREGQRMQVKVISWSPINEDGKYGHTRMVVRSGITETLIVEEAVKDSNQAKKIAEGILRKRADQLVKGNARIIGDPTIRVGQKHTLIMNPFGKCGAMMSGEHELIGVKHSFSKAGYITEFDINRDRLSEVK